jgi:hypothetical protein
MSSIKNFSARVSTTASYAMRQGLTKTGTGGFATCASRTGKVRKPHATLRMIVFLPVRNLTVPDYESSLHAQNHQDGVLMTGYSRELI